METQTIVPHQKIAGSVNQILVIENKGFTRPFTLPLYANGVPTLLYTSVKGKLHAGSTNHLTLFGQTITPEKLTLTEDFLLIAYFFKPYCLPSLFGIEGPELTDNPIDIQLIAGQNSVGILKEKLLHAINAEAAIALLNEFVEQLMNRSKESHPLLQYVTTRIYKNYSKDVLTELQKELSITERSFQRLFHKGMGTTPSIYRRICQFNAAFIDLNLGKYKNLSELAFYHGYADQSHYIRTFREFTAITPTEYLNIQAS